MKAVLDLSLGTTTILFGQNPIGSLCKINASERVSFVQIISDISIEIKSWNKNNAYNMISVFVEIISVLLLNSLLKMKNKTAYDIFSV